jgi:hypothetical protein
MPRRYGASLSNCATFAVFVAVAEARSLTAAEKRRGSLVAKRVGACLDWVKTGKARFEDNNSA